MRWCKFFRQHGYFLAEVRSEVEPESDFGLVNVVFHTDLGVRAKIGKINLAGASPEETNYLQRKLRSVMARLRGDSLKPGMRYSYNRLQRRDPISAIGAGQPELHHRRGEAGFG